jgi:hypothetical protein
VLSVLASIVPAASSRPVSKNGIVSFLQAYTKGSVVFITTGFGWTTEGVGVRVPIVENFHISISPRPALGPIQPPIQWVKGALSQG